MTEHQAHRASTTHDTSARREERQERLRRADALMKRQRLAAVVVAAVLVLGGGAFALLRPGAGTPAKPASGSPTPSAVATSTPSAAATTTPSKPATATPAKPATESASATAGVKPLSPAPGVKTIVLDKSDQLVTLYTADGTPVDRFPCASGHQYPYVGTYKVFGFKKQSWALANNTTFYYFTKFAISDKGNNIGFHSIPQFPDGTLDGGLGKPISHGCVRLDKAKAKFVYNWAKIGTRVVVKK